jgi:hypothetical protein
MPSKVTVRTFWAMLLAFLATTIARAESIADSAIHSFNATFLIQTNGQTYYCGSTTNFAYQGTWGQAMNITVMEDAYDRTRSQADWLTVSNLLTTYLAHEGSDWSWDTWNDDIGWMTIACIRGYQITGKTALLSAATNNWNMAFNRGWDNTFGGGVWEYMGSMASKTALANDSLMVAGAIMYQITGDSSYLNKCEAMYAWERTNIFVAIPAQATNGQALGQINEAIQTNGTPEGVLFVTDLVRNSGTFIEAANALHNITGNPMYYNDALLAADHVVNNNLILSYNGRGANFWGDQFARGLAHFCRDNNLWGRYYMWLLANANAAWNVRRTDKNVTWNSWINQTPQDACSSMECEGGATIQQVVPAMAWYLTSTNIALASPANWTQNLDWQTNSAAPGNGTGATQTGPFTALAAGGSYEIVSNGAPITSGAASVTVPFIRTPNAGANSSTVFPGFSLTVDANTVLMYKAASNQVDYYPLLILNGGVLAKALGSVSTAVITGAVDVVHQSYLSSGTDKNRVSNPAPNAETFNLAAALYGSGNLFLMNFLTNAPNIISGGTPSQGYSGTWIVQYGWLLGTAPGSLGTNSSVIIDPSNTLYKADMPAVTASVGGPGQAVFQVGYAYNTTGTLSITNGGVMNLTTNCTFSAVTINGASLSAGVHSYSELSNSYPNNFLPGGSGTITVQPLPYFTSTNIAKTTPGSWTQNLDWQTNTAVPGNGTRLTQTGPFTGLAADVTYEMVPNGVAITSGSGSPTVTFVRTPQVSAGGSTTFPGVSLTVDANTVLMYKAASNQVDYYPSLILNGGVLAKALGSASTAVINGAVNVVHQSYLSSGTDKNRISNPAPNAEVFNISAALSGSGNLFLMNFLTNAPNIISGGTASQGYAGTWIIQYGWLLGTTPGSLGTSSSVIIDPSSTLYKADMPGVTASVGGPGQAVFQVAYAYNTTGTLTITNGGVMNLTTNCTFSAVTINGANLSAGVHLYSELFNSYPNNFLPGGSGSITVQAVNTVPPRPSITAISVSGNSLSLTATNGSPGGPWTLMQSTNVTLPLNQWQTTCAGNFDGGGNLFTNLLNTATNSREFYILKVQ